MSLDAMPANPLDTDSEDDEKAAFWDEMQSRFGGPISLEQIRQWELEEEQGQIEDQEMERSGLLVGNPDSLVRTTPHREHTAWTAPAQAELRAATLADSSSSGVLPATGWLTPVTPHKATHAGSRPHRRNEPADLASAEVCTAHSRA